MTTMTNENKSCRVTSTSIPPAASKFLSHCSIIPPYHHHIESLVATLHSRTFKKASLSLNPSIPIATFDWAGRSVATLLSSLDVVDPSIGRSHSPHAMSWANRSNLTEEDFYVRFFVGQKHGTHLHEFLEFELLPGGKLRYANSSKYGEESLLRREFFLSPQIVQEIKHLIRDSRIIDCDDSKWPEPFDRNGAGMQELEVKLGCHHVSFQTTDISAHDIKRELDQNGLSTFYRLGYDLRSLVMTLISCHFKQRPFEGAM